MIPPVMLRQRRAAYLGTLTHGLKYSLPDGEFHGSFRRKEKDTVLVLLNPTTWYNMVHTYVLPERLVFMHELLSSSDVDLARQ